MKVQILSKRWAFTFDSAGVETDEEEFVHNTSGDFDVQPIPEEFADAESDSIAVDVRFGFRG